MTLLEKKSTLTLLRLDLYNLYACPLVLVTAENSENQQSLILQIQNNFVTVN